MGLFGQHSFSLHPRQPNLAEPHERQVALRFQTACRHEVTHTLRVEEVWNSWNTFVQVAEGCADDSRHLAPLIAGVFQEGVVDRRELGCRKPLHSCLLFRAQGWVWFEDLVIHIKFRICSYDRLLKV